MNRTMILAGTMACMLAFGIGAAHAQQVSLDNAVRNAAWGLSGNIESGSRIAVLAMQADSARMSNYLIDEMTAALTGLQGVQGFTVMPRSQVNQHVGGLPFSTSDMIDGAMAQSIGRVLGVRFVVAGSLESIAGFFRLRVQVVDVETADVRAIHSADVQNDGMVAYLMGTGVVAPGRAERPANVDGDHLRVNWFSGGIGVGTGDGFTGFSLNARYERDFNHIFSLGVAAFYSFPVDFGIALATRLFLGRSPVYVGLDLGIGGMDGWWWCCDECGYERWLNIGVLVTPTIGLRFGGQTGGFFGRPFISLPMVIMFDGGFAYRFLPGVAVGGAW